MSGYKENNVKRVLINFPESYLADMDRIAAKLGLTRPELVRIAVSHWTVCDDGEKALREKIIASLES